MQWEKHQLILIGGGTTFDDKEEFYEYLQEREYNPYEKRQGWKNWLKLGISDKFEIFNPEMPNKWWADYEARKIWFEKILPYLNKEKELKLVLIGHSLGGIFLAKYLAENELPKQIDQLHLVAPVFDEEGLVGEKLGNFIFNPDDLKNIEPQANKINFYHSKDDEIVPYDHSVRFCQYLTKAKLHTFEDRGHFIQPAFMELMAEIVGE